MSTPTPGAANALPLYGPIVMSEIMYSPLAPGDVMVDRITRNLPAGNRHGHTDHGSVQTAAILALANHLRFHSLPLGHQVCVSLSVRSQFFGYNQIVEAAAHDLLRSVTKNFSELPVHPHHLVVHVL